MPPNRGKKPLPEGPENCLFGKTFMITGILDSLLRTEAEKLIEKYAGYDKIFFLIDI